MLSLTSFYPDTEESELANHPKMFVILNNVSKFHSDEKQAAAYKTGQEEEEKKEDSSEDEEDDDISAQQE